MQNWAILILFGSHQQYQYPLNIFEVLFFSLSYGRKKILKYPIFSVLPEFWIFSIFEYWNSSLRVKAVKTRRKWSFVGYSTAPTYLDCASICAYFYGLRIAWGYWNVHVYKQHEEKQCIRFLAVKRLCNLDLLETKNWIFEKKVTKTFHNQNILIK